MVRIDHPPTSLYVHIPWCARKCPYCDFNSHPQSTGLDEGAYVRALLADLTFELPLLQQRVLVSVFIGGGTPSLFSGRAIRGLLDGIGQRIEYREDMEVTLEANPGTLDSERFHDYRQAGVNRLSIGAQSFDAGCLARLGRIHGPEEIHQTVATARDAGFDNINLDLMFGLPGQTRTMAAWDVETALQLAPEHISYYQLTLEPNTPFASKPPPLPLEDEIWGIQDAGQALLQQAGYAQYEISAFARDGYRCRHNLNYWQFGDYAGIGAGAHGKLTDAGSGRIMRRWRLRSPERFREAAGTGEAVSGERLLGPADLELEFMMNLLRLTDGFDPALLPARTGLAPGDWLHRVHHARESGLLEVSDSWIRPTALGQRFLNDLLARFDLS